MFYRFSIKRILPYFSFSKRFRKKYAVSESALNWWENKPFLASLQSQGLSTEELLESKAVLPLNYVKFNLAVEILQECGLKVNLGNVSKFNDFYATDLNQTFGENASKEVSKNLLKHLQPFPFDPSLRLPSMAAVAKIYKPTAAYQRQSLVNSQVEEDWPNNVEEEQVLSIENEQRRILRQYFAWYLKSNLYVIDKTLYYYNKTRGLRSFKSLRQTLQILEEELEFDRSKILRNFFVTCIMPVRLRDVIDNVPTIGAYSLKEAARLAPKILSKSSEETNGIEKLLKSHGIPDNGSQFRVHLHTFCLSTVESRLKQLKSGDLAPYALHPRICCLLYRFNRASRRLKELKARGFQCNSLNLLVCTESIFERYLLAGLDRSHTITDICLYLSKRLNLDVKLVDRQLSKHSMRYFISLVQVSEILDLLLERGFTAEHILDVLPIVFYSREKITEILDDLGNNGELADLGFEVGFIRSKDGCKVVDKRLQLCYYYLEKPYHFTGEGALPTSKVQEE